MESCGNAIVPIADDLDDVSKFYFTNMLLPQPARYLMTPTSGFKDGFIDITEEGLMQAIGISNDVRPYYNRIFNISMTAVSAQGLYQEAVRQKGVLITNSLFKLTRDNKDAEIRAHKRGYHATVKLLDDPPSSSGRYLLSGTFRTNGQELQLIAFDTKKKKVSNIASAELQGVDRLLTNVEQVFPDLDAVQQHFKDAHKVTIVGIDLGETYTAAACCIKFDPGNGTAVRNLAIKRKALYQPNLMARQHVEQSKSSKVMKTEQAIPSRSACTYTASLEHARQAKLAEPALKLFYGSKRFKRLSHDMKKAKRGEFDVATNAILKMANCHIGRKKGEDEQVLFAIGMGDFNTHTRLSSLHTSFATYFINKVK